MFIEFSPRRWSVATQTFALQVLIAVLVVAAGLLGAYVQARRAGAEEAVARATAVARTVAATPAVVTAVEGPDPTATLQPYAMRVGADSGTDFVVIMSPDAIRWTHPDPAQIGHRFIGHTEAALAGGTVVEDYTGTLGPSTRVVVPVRDGARIVALVAVGIRTSAVGEQVRAQLPGILLAGLAAAAVTGLGMALVARRVRRQTHGLGERQLRDMYEYYDAVLHAVTEGLLIVDLDGTLRLANDEAVRLLDLPADAVGRPVRDLGLAAPLTDALTDGEPHEDELHVTKARVLVLNQGPAMWRGRLLGHVATLRDRTDLEALTGELDSARGLTEALRSQAHESANRLHTIVSLIELGHTDRALAFATDELQVSQRLTDRVVAAVEEPALSAVLLGKAAEASERGIDFVVAPGSHWPRDVAPARDVVTIAGNLLDNAIDAVSASEGERRVTVDAHLEDATDQEPYAVLAVSDTGPGLPPGGVDDAFRRGFSTKEQGSAGRRGIGLALVAQSVERLGGTLEVSGPPGATFTVRLPRDGARREMT
ncbi:histidine kinase [Intrasporangium oryzae NRRL B-24470]|uniref:histidine kinase n=1 Tax=Intrasporangium oryzae NRRL B-24470 TaxID=1386089 RepID=W9G8I8_9MICO|nr:sensor histidine kinase [Intrasporangium oryzae]EWT02375.1 histidine kinase [Intrasporangium oryzae NRRL B-24470]